MHIYLCPSYSLSNISITKNPQYIIPLNFRILNPIFLHRNLVIFFFATGPKTTGCLDDCGMILSRGLDHWSLGVYNTRLKRGWSWLSRVLYLIVYLTGTHNSWGGLTLVPKTRVIWLLQEYLNNIYIYTHIKSLSLSFYINYIYIYIQICIENRFISRSEFAQVCATFMGKRTSEEHSTNTAKIAACKNWTWHMSDSPGFHRVQLPRPESKPCLLKRCRLQDSLQNLFSTVFFCNTLRMVLFVQPSVSLVFSFQKQKMHEPSDPISFICVILLIFTQSSISSGTSSYMSQVKPAWKESHSKSGRGTLWVLEKVKKALSLLVCFLFDLFELVVGWRI